MGNFQVIPSNYTFIKFNNFYYIKFFKKRIILLYLECKLMLFFAIQIKQSLELKENQFNLKNFEQFLESHYYKEIVNIIDDDI